MRRRTPIALALLVALSAAAGCATAESDAVGDACSVVVNCQKAGSMSECIDVLGSLDTECLDCIAVHDCDYSSCQKLIPACRLPLAYMGN
jgi:hypothetical protein